MLGRSTKNRLKRAQTRRLWTVGTCCPSRWNLNLYSKSTQVHWSADRWLRLLPSCHIRPKTELSCKIQYRCVRSDFFQNTQRIAKIRARCSISKAFLSPPLLHVHRTLWWTTYVEYSALQFLLATSGEQHLRNSHRHSFLCLKPRSQQQ